MRAIFYVDGFNFYYLRTRHQPSFKWLNIKALADRLVPAGTTVSHVKYYTADVSGKIDSDAPRRQRLLIAAMKTIPEISIFKGRFLYNEKWAGLVQPPRAKPDNYVWNLPAPDVVLVKKTEEKGSDVNLGSHLVRDAFTDAFDVAYVITNDTDLVEPIRIVTEEVRKPVGIVAPCRPRKNSKGKIIPIPSPSLEKVSSFKIYIDNKDLAAAQFPDTISRAGKTSLSKPETWV